MKRSEVPFDLPKGVRPKHGALYAVSGVKVNGTWSYEWHRLCAIADGEAQMYTALGKLKSIAARGNWRDSTKAFRADVLPAWTPGVRKEAERMFGVIDKGFEDFNVDEPEGADVLDFVAQFKKTPAAAKHYKALLSSFFRWSIGKRMRTDNPCTDVWLKKGKRKPIAWTPEVYNKIRVAMVEGNGQSCPNGVMMQCYLDLAFLIYQRSTDVRILERKNVKADVIYFHPTKTRGSSGVELTVPITPEIRAVLDRAAAESKRLDVVCPYVIHTRGGTAFTRSGIYSAFRRAAKRAGVTGINPKSLRPFSATMANEQGSTLEELQDGLGHEDIQTTQIYVQKNQIRRSKVRLKLPPAS